MAANRATQLSVGFSFEEIALLRELAEYAGLPLSTYIRMATLLYSRDVMQRADDRTAIDRLVNEASAPAR